MKIFLICSKYCYGSIQSIADDLVNNFNHEIIYPDHYKEPWTENNYIQDPIEHRAWKGEMFRHSIEEVNESDVVLVLNLNIPHIGDGYIGGATMLEMYEAFRQNKKVFVYNKLPECSYKDELNGLTTKVIFQDLSLIV